MQKNLNNEHLVRDPLHDKAEVRKEPKRTTKQLLIGLVLLAVVAGAAILFGMPQQGDAYSAVEAYLRTEPVLIEKYGQGFTWRLTNSEIVTRVGHEDQDVRTGVYLLQIGGDTWEAAAHQQGDAWVGCAQCLKQVGLEEE
ncbi:MAG: hypothetical protein IJ461_00630 [Clostridia bacterium]|nr:hypothetical protein [Clostridia bacterium]